MRKMKKINGFLVVRFNDREKRVYPALGSFGVIDAELYTGILDVDRSVMEYDDAETLEIALEQARSLESELDVVEPEVKITVIIEGETEVSEEDVEPESLFKGQRATLEAQLKHGPHLDLDPLTAAHELHGYAKALEDLGMIDGHDERFLVEHNTFGEVCKHREGRTQEELEAICETCRVDRWAGDPPTLTPEEVKNLRGLFRLADEVSEYVTDEKSPRERETFQNAPSGVRNDYNTKKVYALGLALAGECPDNDCRVYLNIFNAARELDEALDTAKPNSAPFLALRSALMQYAGELWEMYEKNYAVNCYLEGMEQ